MSNTIQTINDELNVVFNSSCKCADCESGVSPLAYFTDLLKYAYKNIKRNSGNGDKSLIDIKTPTSVDIANNKFLLAGHCLFNDDLLHIGDIGGITGTGWEKDNIVYVVNRTNNDFKVSLTKSGSPIDIGGSLGSTYFYPKGSFPSYNFFKHDFYQNLEDFPINCNTSNSQICQVRYAIETLYNYREANASLTTEKLNDYLNKTYYTLLIAIGTSYDELRLISGASTKKKQELADKLGFFYEASSHDIFYYLLLKFNSSDPLTELNEENIERVFGLVDTRKDSFSTGSIVNNPIISGKNFITRWHFEGIEWGVNTNNIGNVYLGQNNSDPNSIYLYKDLVNDFGEDEEFHHKLIAIGTPIYENSKTYKFSQYNGSNVKGYITFIQSSIPTGEINLNQAYISIFPKVICWQLQKLQNSWKKSDLENLAPIIDPDIIGLQDIKNIYDTNENSIINLWQNRKSDFDDERNALKTDRENNIEQDIITSGISSIYTPISMFKGTGYSFYILNSAISSGQKYLSKITNGSGNWSLIDKGSLDGQLDSPKSMFSYSDDIYFADNSNYKIKCFDKDANFKWKIALGEKISALDTKKPNSIIFDSKDDSFWTTFDTYNKILKFYKAKSFNNIDYIFSNDNTVCYDQYNNSYEVFSSSHKLVKCDPTGKVIWVKGKTDKDNNYISGNGTEEFNHPNKIVFGLDGYLYVNDSSNNRIHQISIEGNFIRNFSTSSSAFGTLSDIKQDQAGNIYILDKSNAKIIQLDKYGIFQNTIGTSGTNDGQFSNPLSIAIDKDNYIYVADTGNNRIQIFSQTGQFVSKINGNGSSGGTGFYNPYCIALGYSEIGELILYIADNGNDRILQINKNGTFIAEIKDTTKFTQPNTVTVDNKNRVYIGSTYSQKLIIRDSSAWKVFSNYAAYSHINPTGITVKDNFIIVADDLNNNLVIFNNDDNISNISYNYNWGNLPTGFFSVLTPAGLFIDNSNKVYVTNGSSVITTLLPELLSLPSNVTPDVLKINNINSIYVSTSNKVYRFDKGTWTEVVSDFSGKYFVDDLGYIYKYTNPTSNTETITVNKYAPDGTAVGSLSLTDFSTLCLDNYNNLYRLNFNKTNIKSKDLTLGLGLVLGEGMGFEYKDFIDIGIKIENGIDVQLILKNIGLTYTSYNYLKTINEYISIGATVTESEWSDVYDIIMNAYKRISWYQTWYNLETDNNIFINPLNFNSLSSVDENELVFNKWLTNSKERKYWRKLLKSRKDTIDNILTSNSKLIADVEEISLPVLRDLLISDSDTIVPDNFNKTLNDKANWLSKRLLIDMANNCCTKTNRTSLAIEVLQGLFWGIRNGNLNDFIEDYDYGIADGTFDSNWKTLGSYASWRTAMFINFYPENLLLPSVRKTQSGYFRQLASDIAGDERFSPSTAINVSTKYGDYLADISNMDIQASVYCDIPELDEYGNLIGSGKTKNNLFIFGIGRDSGNLYYCSLESGKEISSNLKDWVKLDQLKKIYYLLGAVVVYDAKVETKRIVVLAITKHENNMSAISMISYNTQSGVWGSEQEDIAIDIDVPSVKFPLEVGGLHATLVRNPYDKIKYEDRENWGNFNDIGETHFMPAISLSLWGVSYLGYLDFKGKKITHVTNNSHTTVESNAIADGYVAPGALYQIAETSTKTNTFIELAVNIVKIGNQSNIYKPYCRILDKNGKTIKRLDITQLSDYDFAGSFFHKQQNTGTKIFSFWKNRQNGKIRCYLVTETSVISVSNVTTPVYSFNKLRILDHSNSKRTTEVKNGFDMNSIIVSSETKTEFVNYSYTPSSNTNFQFVSNSNRSLSPFIPAAPHFLSNNFDDSTIEALRKKVITYLSSVVNNTDIVKSYIEEAFYGIPYIIATQLQKKAYYNEALEWFKLIYDYTKNIESRKIYYGLVLEESKDDTINRPNNWLSDPLNPHNVAKTRRDAYTKFTVQSIVRCLIEYADNEFTKDNIESVSRARELYLEASMLIKGSSLLGGSSYEARESQIQVLERSSIVKIFLQSASSTQLGRWKGAINNLRRLQSPKRMNIIINGPLGLPNDSVHPLLNRPIISIIRYPVTSGNPSMDAKLDAIETLINNEINSNVFEPSADQIKALNDATATQDMFIGNDAIWIKAWDRINQKLEKIESVQRLKVIINTIGTPDRPIVTVIADSSKTTKEKLAEIDNLLNKEISKQLKTQTYFGIEDENRKRKQVAIQAILADKAKVSELLQQVETIKQNYQNALKEITGLKQEKLFSIDKTPQISVAVLNTTTNEWEPKMYAFKAEFIKKTAVKVSKSSNQKTITSVTIEKVLFGETLGKNVKIKPENFIESHPAAAVARANFNSDSTMEVLKSKAATEYLQKLQEANKNLQVLKNTPPKPVSLLSLSFCMPKNPVAEMYLMYADMNLYKLRNCMNIAGIVRELNPFAAPTDSTSGMSYIGVGGQIVTPGQPDFKPTIYRYEFLIERAKQLVSIAQQMETSMLTSLEKFDNEKYAQLQAKQQIKLANANITLSNLKVRQAEGEVRMAEIQKEKAEFQRDHYDGLISAGLNGWETMSKFSMLYGITQQAAGTGFAVAGIIEEASKVGPGGKFGNIANATYNSLKALAEFASAQSAYYNFEASFSRREQEWQFSRDLSGKDVEIGSQQIKQAQTGVQIAGQETRIAELQQQNNEDSLNFLLDKFTNAELYAWMSGVLEKVYSYFLQHATSVARQAQNQLAFERQEMPPQFIKTDYWEAPINPGDQKSADRKGLTGSARILQDIYSLDQYAIDTDVRKLQMSKTISLATLYPEAFQQFRKTGILPFDTTLVMFDKDFPGHYIRLIRQVKTSVIALIPPNEGIKATLSSKGNSKVVTKTGAFYQKVDLNNKGSETVALTSAQNATGMFELQATNNKLNPFEGIGVEASWEFSMSRASNAFDFNTIADVLITMDYTALNSFEYKNLILKELDSEITAQRTFSVKNNFPDQWYDLGNQINPKSPFTFDLEISKSDYPSNLIEDPSISRISFLFTYTGNKKNLIRISHFKYQWIKKSGDNEFSNKINEGDGGESINILSGSNEIVGSVIRSTQGDWNSINNAAAFGKLSLTLDETSHFNNNEIEDILLIIEYSSAIPQYI
jgi:sugar lactone lactonase YvrE